MLPEAVSERMHTIRMTPKFPHKRMIIGNLGNVDGLQLLSLFETKAADAYTQDEALEIWEFLRRYLWDEEEVVLFVAWEHFRFGRGKIELRNQIAGIRKRMEKGLYKGQEVA